VMPRYFQLTLPATESQPKKCLCLIIFKVYLSRILRSHSLPHAFGTPFREK
jgi:hypothetical protein